MNNVSIGGRLTREPELRYFESGKCIANVTLAIDRFKDKENPENDVTDFIQVKAWEKTAELIGEHFKKGDYLLVSGELNQESWETEDGEKRSKLLVVARKIDFGCPKRSGGGGGREVANEEPKETPPSKPKGKPF